ncbi:hypothetical protein KSP39_PZI023298 [Platanthera zijinensis]|uniref:Uncharacterized protein n=1 Tax=Platanthera zijinensis TaxID=2320716 RepID=A0AAP0AW42_9ASPA
MSDSRERQEEEAWSGEEDELIPSCSQNLHHTDEIDGGNGQIPRGKQQHQQQKPGISATDRRKGKTNTKENDKKGGSKVNRRKMQEKADQILLSSIGKFRKHLEGTKNIATDTIIRRSAAPFPYDGKDFGGSPSSLYLCFRPPSIPPASDSPGKEELDAPAGAVDTANPRKPNHSSHYFFVKSLIEKNKFYSPECNPHRKVTGGSHAR